MHCPFCRSDDTRVIDSRTNDDGTNVRRRRQCTDCNRRFTTVENAVLLVIKRNGVVEAFDRSKIINGVKKACQGRPV
jgi:transcriptional repressor NrdR